MDRKFTTSSSNRLTHFLCFPACYVSPLNLSPPSTRNNPPTIDRYRFADSSTITSAIVSRAELLLFDYVHTPSSDTVLNCHDVLETAAGRSRSVRHLGGPRSFSYLSCVCVVNDLQCCCCCRPGQIGSPAAIIIIIIIRTRIERLYGRDVRPP